MTDLQMLRQNRDLKSYLESIEGDNLSYRQVFEQIGHAVPFAEALVITTMPRGSLQIVQPTRVSETLLKSYVKDYHAEDRATWQAILTRRPTRGEDCWGNDQPARYQREFMESNGLQYLVAAPLQAPVFEGYAGALHLYRDSEQGPFTDAELDELASIAADLDAALRRVREARLPENCREDRAWAHRPPVRQFIFDSQLRPQLPAEDLALIDQDLREQIVQHARQQIEHVNGQMVTADRLLLPDARGDNWTFRVITHKRYPALGDGPFVFFCLQPECCDWATVRPTDFQADAELARLIPAVQFMQQEFHRSPTLVETSKVVHLSPFHFHRRFTELLGLTPKHFLLECQIFEAKRQLLAREKDLAQIAADCGFAHQSHFTSRFKQATGLTPTRWRKYAQDLERSAGN